MSERRLTGHHVFWITVGAFAVIIAVNMTLAVKAVGTFPGLEVRNSYVASQSFEARRAAQEALGWTVSVDLDSNGVRLHFTDAAGLPIRPAQVSLLIGRQTSRADDVVPDLRFADGVFSAPVSLAPGFWTLRLRAEAADGTLFERRLEARLRQ